MKRFIALFVVVFSLFTSQFAFADGAKFDNAAFEALLAEGKPVLVVAHAPWCPTCRKQASILKELFTKNENKEIAYLVIDYDNQKDVLQKFNISKQSTIITFKAGKEVGRSLGDTSTAGVQNLLQKSL
jgi:thioredoxin 1